MDAREYLVRKDNDLGFELVSGTDILQGSHRGQEYRSVRADLGQAQKSVFETLLHVQASGPIRIQDRRQKIQDLLPSFKSNREKQKAALKAKFDRLREVVNVLEEAVIDKSAACYEEDLEMLNCELLRCTELEQEVQHNMSVARSFIWDDNFKDSKAPAAVAQADLNLSELSQLGFESIETRDAAELINLSTIESTAEHLEQCALQSGLKLPPRLGVPMPAGRSTVLDTMDPGCHQADDVFARLHRDALKKQLCEAGAPQSTGSSSFPSVELKPGYFDTHAGGHTDLNRSPAARSPSKMSR